MFFNYLKTTSRYFLKNKLFSLINIIGLSIGLVCSIIILLAVHDDLNYDSFNQHYDNIYRVLQEMPFTEKATWAITQGPLGPALINEVPEIRKMTRVANGGWSIRFDEERLYSFGIYSDSTFLSMFSYNLIQGDPNTALSQSHSVILTKDLALKIFGDNDPMGKILSIFDKYELEVTGIMENPPTNSHLKFEFIGTMELAKEIGYTVDQWRNSTFITYVLLPDNASQKIVENKIHHLLDEKPTLEEGSTLKLQPLSEIHLSSGIEFENADVGKKSYVVIFISAAFFILTIACINFMNLTTARSLKRAKEIGLRKVVGARRKQIIIQFMVETGIMVVSALIISIFIIEAFLPYLNQKIGKDLSLDLFNYQLAFGFILLVIITILLSGAYPAFFMSSVMPARIIKGSSDYGAGNSRFKKLMVIIQFITSIVLMIGSYTVLYQVKYLQNKDLGYKKENIVYVPIDQKIRAHLEVMKNELLDNNNIENVTSSASFPTNGYIFSNNLWDWSGKDPDYELLFHCEYVDYHYFNTFGIDIVEGRSFSQDFRSDTTAVILNEKAVELMGMDNPIGETILYDSKTIYTIIGVARNFNFRSLHKEIEPLIILLNNQSSNYLWVRLKPDNINATIGYIKEKWETVSPDNTFWYNFLDLRLKSLYQTEQSVGIMLSAFSILAVILLCLGLFGLIGYSVVQRYKEISIRKVFGAKSSSILVLFVKEYARLMLVATIIGIPLINYFIQEWLSSFPYRIEIGFMIFSIPVLVLFIISLSIILSQSIKATRINVAETLRNE
jgi:ABC-type antimicrobial peptide transport system permease subunit